MTNNVQRFALAGAIILAVSVSLGIAFGRTTSLQQAAEDLCGMAEAGAADFEMVAFAQDAADGLADDIYPIDVVFEADFRCGMPESIYTADLGGDPEDGIFDDEMFDESMMDGPAGPGGPPPGDFDLEGPAGPGGPPPPGEFDLDDGLSEPAL